MYVVENTETQPYAKLLISG